ncbi:hypothetical protein ACFC8T_00810 [Enterococcus casseliflavus]|uniref:Uncharacterized protein n=1 Tax=Enterococcus casseliflavus TaxID=37734 RepID=A0ABD5FHI6_ENTCA|nr:hypothetical protein [Enterococcus casseliflavus]MDT2981179.1 hypothetical protein [Enterococcus casseliflavus]
MSQRWTEPAQIFLSNRQKEENGDSSCRENLQLFFYLQAAIDDEATVSAHCALADLLCLEK